MNFQQRTERIRSYSLVVLVLLSLISASFFALLPTKAKALENNDNLPISQQHARTLLYALERCVDKHLNSMPTASEVNAVDVFNNQSSDGVSIGYEIDTDNGARQCNNLDYSKALGFIDMDASDIRNMYTCNNGTCSLKGGSKDSLLTRMRQKMRERAHSGGRVYGPKERARRLAVTLSRCIEPLGDGLHPERGSLITIDGSRFQLRDGMSMKDKISAGIDMEPVDGKYECETLINLARNENVLDSLPDGVTLASLFSNPNAISGEGDAAGGDATEVEKSCESEGGNMSWILCSVLGIADQVVKVLDRTLTRILLVPNAFLEDEGLKRAWSRLRNLAYIILIPIVLVMVIGTALGFDFVSAYTVKRAMPRLLIATIFIALSFDISRFLVELTNVVGVGIYGMITSAFTSDPITLESIFAPAPGQGAVSLGLTLALGFGALAVGSIGIILSYMLVTLVGLAIGFFLLSLRQILIVVLMILAPVAILAWIFPGNDKLWKLWWGTFSKLLMLFPLVMILIAAGRSFAYTIHEVRADDEWPLMISTLMKLVAYVGPFFFIPALFKFAGGAFATITGITNDKSRGIFDRSRKKRGELMSRNWQDTLAGNKFKGGTPDSLRGRFNRGLQRTAFIGSGKAGLDARKWGARAAAGASNASILGREAMLEDNDYTWKGNDTLNRAAFESENEAELRAILRDSGDYKGEHGRANLERDVAKVETMRRKYGNDAFKQATWLSAVAGGTAYRGMDDPWSAAGDAFGHDNALLADMVAKGRSAAMSAGRIDQGGAGFGHTFALAKGLATGKFVDPDTGNVLEMNREASAAWHAENVLRSQGPAILAHSSMKPTAVENLVPHMKERIQEAANTGSKDEFAQALGETSGVMDYLYQNSPQNAEKLAAIQDEVILDPATGTQMTVREWSAMYARAQEPKYMEMKQGGYSASERMRNISASAPTSAPTSAPNTPPTTP